MNFYNITVSIEDHELSDSGIIHRLYQNIILPIRVVEERLYINGDDGKDRIKKLTYCPSGYCNGRVSTRVF